MFLPILAAVFSVAGIAEIGTLDYSAGLSLAFIAATLLLGHELMTSKTKGRSPQTKEPIGAATTSILPRKSLTTADSVSSARPCRLVIVMPAFNAAKTLARTYADIPRDLADHVIVADDASVDTTVDVARRLGLKVIRHKRNLGYGGNQKTCYDAALATGADIVVMLHPDHQYDPKVIPDLIGPIAEGRADAVFGSRMLGRAFIEGGMPKWKFYANVLLTAIANIGLHTYLTEFHSGFRAYSRHYLESVRYQHNSNDFVFDTEIIIQGLHRGLVIREVPIQTRYFDEASQIGFRKSIRYGLGILAVLVTYKAHCKGIIHDRRFA